MCFEALSADNGTKSAALAIVCGSHFLEKKDAEQIFDAIITSDHYDLIYSCIKQVRVFFLRVSFSWNITNEIFVGKHFFRLLMCKFETGFIPK